MGCETSSGKPDSSSSAFVSTSLPPIDEMYERASAALLSFHNGCSPVLVAMDSFLTVAEGQKGTGMMATALTATLIATIADLESSGLPTLRTDAFPGLKIAKHALTHEESKRAWTLWSLLAKDLMDMVVELEKYFPESCYCAALPRRVEACMHSVSTKSEIRVIDLRKLGTVVSFNNASLVESAREFHEAVLRVKTRILEAVAVLESLRSPVHLKRLKDLGTAACKIQAFDPQLVLEHFESGIRHFLQEIIPR